MRETLWLREKVDYSLYATHGSVPCINRPFVVYRGQMVHVPLSIALMTLTYSEVHNTTLPGATSLLSGDTHKKRGTI
jgi:hypothetical protein